jgi:hypothetical protein
MEDRSMMPAARPGTTNAEQFAQYWPEAEARIAALEQAKADLEGKLAAIAQSPMGRQVMSMLGVKT